MPETIEFQSRIGKDGVLDLHVPLDAMGPGTDVLVTIRKIPGGTTPRITDRAEWHRFVGETYGSCADLGLERPPQGEFEKREAVE